ncbi:4-hydroxy-3-methylbut-2-enyl diphosphate reductase [subsurface metagenome]
MEIIIDKGSGFCFGVRRAISMAEKEASRTGELFCLGDIVHNTEEVKRLSKRGIEFITRDKYFTLSDCKVLIRAHGEPPETYEYAQNNNIQLIDATCPVVLKLQEKVKNAQQINPQAQIVIFGRKKHPEIIGLYGQVKDAVIIESVDDISKVNYSKPIFLFAQTTKDTVQYAEIQNEMLEQVLKAGGDINDFIVYDSICVQVANRVPHLAKFSQTVDTLLFVGGKSSSNSKMLFDVCKDYNQKSFFITSINDLDKLDLSKAKKIGICGATSTPSWLIGEIGNHLKATFS